MNIFPSQELSETEKHILAEKLSDPTVKKYLHLLAYNMGSAIALMKMPDNADEEQRFLRSMAAAQGNLQVIDTLLSIAAVPQNPVN